MTIEPTIPGPDFRRVRVAFWAALVTATWLYAIVALSPGCLVLGDLTERISENQRAVRSLESQVNYLEQVRSSLQADPAYAKELALLDHQGNDPGEIRLPVASSLRLARFESVTRPILDVPGTWTLRPVVEALAHEPALKSTILVIAAAIVLLAFTLLQDSHAERLNRWAGRLKRS